MKEKERIKCTKKSSKIDVIKDINREGMKKMNNEDYVTTIFCIK